MNKTQKLIEEMNWYSSFKQIDLTAKYERSQNNELSITVMGKIETDKKTELKKLKVSFSLSKGFTELCRKNDWNYVEVFYSENKNRLAFKFTSERKTTGARRFNNKNKHVLISASSLIPIIKKYFGGETIEKMELPRKLVLPKEYDNIFIF